jgi:hypothetical protein
VVLDNVSCRAETRLGNLRTVIAGDMEVDSTKDENYGDRQRSTQQCCPQVWTLLKKEVESRPRDKNECAIVINELPASFNHHGTVNVFHQLS